MRYDIGLGPFLFFFFFTSVLTNIRTKPGWVLSTVDPILNRHMCWRYSNDIYSMYKMCLNITFGFDSAVGEFSRFTKIRKPYYILLYLVYTPSATVYPLSDIWLNCRVYDDNQWRCQKIKKINTFPYNLLVEYTLYEWVKRHVRTNYILLKMVGNIIKHIIRYKPW